ncbi:MAG: hypothetical protein ACI88A_000541 [Paraglaciecola sp.]|jgi:hypothetical protein
MYDASAGYLILEDAGRTMLSAWQKYTMRTFPISLMILLNGSNGVLCANNT